jgi:hypothetical protein
MTACFRCEQDFPLKKLIFAEGCALCQDCYDHIQISYAVEMLKEEGYIQQTSKCKGCEG